VTAKGRPGTWLSEAKALDVATCAVALWWGRPRRTGGSGLGEDPQGACKLVHPPLRRAATGLGGGGGLRRGGPWLAWAAAASGLAGAGVWGFSPAGSSSSDESSSDEPSSDECFTRRRPPPCYPGLRSNRTKKKS